MKLFKSTLKTTKFAGPAAAMRGARSERAAAQLQIRPAVLWLATLAVLGFMSVVVWRPFGANAMLHNLASVLLLAGGCTALVVAASQVETARDWSFFAAHMVLVGFLVRSISVLVLPYPPLHDGYYYLAALQNIVERHSLRPLYWEWYSGIRQQLSWPIMHLIAAQLHTWTGIQVEELWRFLPPALGSLTFVIVSLVAFKTLPSWRFASLAGLLGSMGDLVLYYQNEYHPQGFAVVLFMFLVFMLLSTAERGAFGARSLLLLVVATFAFSHHGSSLGLPLTLTPLIFLPLVARPLSRVLHAALPRLKIPPGSLPQIVSEAARTRQYQAAILLTIVVCLAIHLYIFSGVFNLMMIDFFSSLREETQPVFIPLVSQEGPPWWIVGLRWGKYLVLLSSLIGFMFVLRRPSPERIVLALATGVLMVLSLAGSSGTTRFLAFWYCLAAVASAWGLAMITRGWTGRWLVRSAVIVGASVYLMIGVVNQQIPAFIFEQLPRAAGVRYGNSLPRTDHLALAGRWVAEKTPANSTYAVDFSTRVAPFYFGRIDDRAIAYARGFPSVYCYVDYYLVDHELSRDSMLNNAIPLDVSHLPRLYDNGTIEVRAKVSESACLRDLDVAGP